MLYLPPLWAHDGVAVGECMTASVGFRAPGPAELARELLARLAEDVEPARHANACTAMPASRPPPRPGAIPPALQAFAARCAAARRCATRRRWTARSANGSPSRRRASGSTPPARHAALSGGLALDRRTRMMYDARHVFINGESFRAGGRDARLLRQLADRRRLDAAEVAG